MKRSGTLFLCLGLVAAVTLPACGGGPVRRINPPVATIQRLDTALPEWSMTLRIENFSTVPMRFLRMDLSVELGGFPAGNVAESLALDVPGISAEVVDVSLTPPDSVREVVATLRRAGARVSYTLRGEIVSSDPDKRFPFEASSWLNPVPGRPDEFR
jgi:hypothetical protein